MSRRENEVGVSSAGAEGLVSHGRNLCLLSLRLGAQSLPEDQEGASVLLENITTVAKPRLLGEGGENRQG